MAHSLRNSPMTATSVSSSHARMLFLLRILQFLACITMLILFSIRLARLHKLTHHTRSSVGAVEGILAASVVYTFLALLLVKRATTKMLRMVFAVMDGAFVCGFIVVAVLTSPERYTAAYSCMGGLRVNYHLRRFAYCSLPWGPFILGILSTISFSATAALGWMGGKVSYAKGKHESGAIDGPVNNSEGVA